MTHPALIERITRSLAYMLRHQPEEFDLELDAHGFGDAERVVQALNERLGEAVTLADLDEAIHAGDRPRYEIVGSRVRALYGHSIDVEPGEPTRPPEFLYVGISARDADRAMQYGLRGGRRRFLHLALTPEDAKEAGRRTGRDYVVITVYALDAWEEGINFYDRKALFLAGQIPTEFLEISETCHDGVEPEHRPASGRREGFDRGRGGHGSGHRGEGRPPRQDDRGERAERGDGRRGGRHERRGDYADSGVRPTANAGGHEEPAAADSFGQGFGASEEAPTEAAHGDRGRRHGDDRRGHRGDFSHGPRDAERVEERRERPAHAGRPGHGGEARGHGGHESHGAHAGHGAGHGAAHGGHGGHGGGQREQHGDRAGRHEGAPRHGRGMREDGGRGRDDGGRSFHGRGPAGPGAGGHAAGGHADRPARHESHERPQERHSAPPSAPAPAPQSAPAAAPRSPGGSSSDPGFGMGIFEEPASHSRREPVKAAPPPAPRPAPPPPPPPAPAESDPFGGFGAGV